MRISVLLLLPLVHFSAASVIAKLASRPAVFGQNVILTCQTQRPLRNSKDCPVRQWTIGANTAVLVYNDFSHNTAKYADNTDLNANNFSIIIKNFSLLDVNQYYTCSCGFSSDTIFLSLEESLFVHKPDNTNLTFDIRNDAVHSNLILQNVFPVPICLLRLKDQQQTNNTSPTVIKNGYFYNVSITFLYNLTMGDCNHILELAIECELHANLKMQYNKTLEYACKGTNDIHSSDRSTSSIIDVNTSIHSSNSTATEDVRYDIILPCIAVGIVLLVVTVLCCCKKRKSLRCFTGESVLCNDDKTNWKKIISILHKTLLPPPRWRAGVSTDGRGGLIYTDSIVETFDDTSKSLLYM